MRHLLFAALLGSLLGGCAVPRTPETGETVSGDTDPEKPEAKETAPKEQIPPKLNIRFLYGMCQDIEAMRKFYSDVLGMDEKSYKNVDDWGWLVYQTEGFQLMFFRDEAATVEERWAWQPGGTSEEAAPLMSFSLEVPWGDYRATVARIAGSNAKTQSEKPQWRQMSYWGWTVKDPMGYTIEVYSTPPDKPAEGEGETPVWE